MINNKRFWIEFEIDNSVFCEASEDGSGRQLDRDYVYDK